MKLTITTLIAALVASMAWVATAEDEKATEKKATEKKATEKREEPRRGGPGGRGSMLSRLPLYKALDTDKDGALSVLEIENACAALLTLDMNSDGKLSKEEIAPAFGGRGGDRQRGGGDRAGGRPRGGGGEGGRPERPKRPSTE